jgi:hypothetical protein
MFPAYGIKYAANNTLIAPDNSREVVSIMMLTGFMKSGKPKKIDSGRSFNNAIFVSKNGHYKNWKILAII